MAGSNFSILTIRDREPKKLVTTGILNETNAAVRALFPTPTTGSKEEADKHPWPHIWMDVKTTGYGSLPGGRYTGKGYTRDTGTPYAATGDLSEPMIGTLPDADDIEIWHEGEIGTATHVLPPDFTSMGRVVGQKDDGQYVVAIPPAIAALTIDAKITGSMLITDNLYRYSWVEQIPERNGRWQDKPDGQSSTSTGEFAYNTIEANNVATGVQGNSIDMDDLPTGYTLQAVRGNPVVQLRQQVDCDGNTFWAFQYENAVQGTCPAP